MAETNDKQISQQSSELQNPQQLNPQQPEQQKEITTIYHEAQPVIRADGTVRDEQHLHVAAYARVSTLKEEQEDSYETQVNYFGKYIESQPEWINVGIYTDKGRSGRYEKNRPGLKRMIDDAEAGKIDLILIKSISRFFRNCYKAQDTLQRLFDLDVEVRFLEGNISSRDPSAAMIIQLLTSIAENESTSISENVKWSYKKLAEQGIRHIGCNRVYGYDEINGVLVPNENADVVSFAFESFASGMSYKDIRMKLKEMGIKTMRGNVEFDSGTLHGMFRNEIYVGDRLLQKEPPTNPNPNAEKAGIPAYESKYIKYDHEGIISREIWNKVQEKLDRRDALMKMGIKAINDPHVLMGKVFCGRCGSFMYIVPQNWTGGFQNCWKCRDRMNGKRGNGCKNALVSDKDLMSQVMERLGLDPEDPATKDFKTYDRVDRIDVLNGKIKITLR